MSESIDCRIDRILEQIHTSAQQAGRDRAHVQLELAVKTRTVNEIAQAVHALNKRGQRAILGQNRVQEAQVSTPGLRDLGIADFYPTLIGPLQKNKINHALRVVEEIETLDTLKLAQAVAKRVEPGRVLNVMVQVNTAREDTKSGVDPEHALELAGAISELPALHLVGFMTIGAHTDDETLVRRSFAQLRQIRDAAVQQGLVDATELSMGMSGDFPLAIAEGATRVRIGSMAFGPRRVA
ncbi:YggS family pyridoxal phosphate-dependent enzyme [Gleimia hominis]|uniref:YggS family pyridoxal phosphate-dependent enzyme n=1 Tax=Gleimia hominis TaxID=595468 RepID=UPI000C7FFDEE|nr:YggS family pyridoxal phosphate-dependent enzyme [Gleimia hominis]WIK65354.1 YggS family pyridoxal phosphate-dependent enzyme [Gleimia hominis]